MSINTVGNTGYFVNDKGELYLFDVMGDKDSRGKWVSNWEVVGSGCSYKVQIVDEDIYAHEVRKDLLVRKGILVISLQ